MLGKLLLKSELLEKDTEKAVRYLERAAGKGNQFAQYLLGKFYLTDEYTSKDIEKAIRSSAN